jgi:hypothetical protein
MEESVTYQAIISKGVAKGAVEEARKFLLRQGRKRFGSPDAQILATLEAISDVNHLESLGERLLDVASWQELLEASRES